MCIVAVGFSMCGCVCVYTNDAHLNVRVTGLKPGIGEHEVGL